MYVYDDREGESQKLDLFRLIFWVTAIVASVVTILAWVTGVFLFVTGADETLVWRSQLVMSISLVGPLCLAVRMVSRAGRNKLLLMGLIMALFVSAAMYSWRGLGLSSLDLARTLVIQQAAALLFILLLLYSQGIGKDVKHLFDLGKRVYRENKETRRK